MENEITSLVEQYNRLSEEYTELSHHLDDLKAQKSAVRTQIIDALENEGLDGAVVAGKQVQVVKKTQYSIFNMDAFLALDDRYHTASLFSINSNKLQSFAKDLSELNDGELPADIKATLNSYDYEDLSVRKAK